MKNNKFNLVTIGAAFVCVLIIVFALLAVRSASDIAEQAELIYQHPYRVKNEAQNMRTRLLEMKLYLLPSLLVADSGELGDDSLRILAERDKLQDASVAVIKEYYLGRSEDLAALDETLARLRIARVQALQRSKELTELQDAMIYVEQWVNPRSDAVEIVLMHIMEVADRRVEVFRKDAQLTRDAMITRTVLLCVVLVMLVMGIDMSDRRKNRAIVYREQLFNLISNSIDDVFFIYDYQNGRLEYVSENSLHLLGLSAQELYADAALIRKGLGPENAYEFASLLSDSALSEIVERDWKYTKNDQELDLKLRLYPIRSEDSFLHSEGELLPDQGTLMRIIVVLSDQSKAIAQQNILSDALLSAQKANRAKQEFFSRMSHEIRTPMNAIMGMTAIAEKYLGEKERVRDALRKIDSSSKHLLSLINDVLDIAKIEEGKLSFSHGEFDFRNFIAALSAIICPQTEARGQMFEITVSGLSEEVLIGDELRLKQMLINLISNAIKFTPSGGEIRLEITRLKTEKVRALLRFVVRDTGIGMSREFLERIYMPFEQADNIAQNYGGTGLGLSITKNLAALMHGSIAVQSEEGKGTAFTLELPFDLPKREATRSRADLKGLKVLVADDDLITCEHAMVLLETIGVRGEWAQGGQEALEKATRAHAEGHDYDVCFIDWRMPNMDGLETARRLRRAVGPDLPIIIISSYDWAAIEHEARGSGVNAFIAKPLFASSLYDALADIRHLEPLEDKAAQAGETCDLSGKKILLAEDNLINQEIALDLLQSAGASVDCANDGQECLEMYLQSKEGEYDLILMDIQMPRMDGYAATRAIRASAHPNAGSVPILAMTANAFNADRLAAEEAGMNGHLAKPIDVAELFRTIQNCLFGL